MSEEEDQVQNEEEEQEEEDEEGDEDEDQEEGDQDEDQDQEGDEDEDEDEEGDQDEEGEGDDEQQSKENVPTFKPVSQQFVFKNLLAQIASIGNSVDHFINTLPSRGGSAYRSYQPRIQMDLKPKYQSLAPLPEKKYTIMKDQDIQVSMQPQIVIQQTLTPKQQPKKQPYRISNESTKFLANLYEENKRLKRWQNTQTGAGSYGNTWYRSKDKFQRPQHERGLINLDDRNREIDQAIQMLRREDREQQQ